MTATLLAAGPSPAANTPTGLASAAPVGGDLTGARCRDLAPGVEGEGVALTRDDALGVSPVDLAPSTPSRDYFNGCHTVTPPAPYQPAFGPWRADRTLAETVAWLAYTLEGA